MVMVVVLLLLVTCTVVEMKNHCLTAIEIFLVLLQDIIVKVILMM